MSDRDRPVELIEMKTPQECAELAAVLAAVWGMADSSGVIAPDALRAMAHSGCYVVGARVGSALVGGGFGWPTEVAQEWRLHSHVVGFLDHHRAAGLGAAVKHHQRDWVRARGWQAIEWTFDPLVARNARFNLAKLGATVESFHRDFYGLIDDEFSAGLGSDRFLVRWGVDDHPSPTEPAGVAGLMLDVAADGSPIVASVGAGRVAGARIPADIVSARGQQRVIARQWAEAFAATVGAAVIAGARVVGITTDYTYVIEMPA